LLGIGAGVSSVQVVDPGSFELGIGVAIAFGSRVLLIVSAIQEFNSIGKIVLVVASVVGKLDIVSDSDACRG
jgi:hypothetical protein